MKRLVVLSVNFLASASFWMNTSPTYAGAAASVSSPLVYTFNCDGILEEAGSMDESTSPYFYLNSGGMLVIKDGIGATIQGSLATGQRWQTAYQSANPLDTGGGYYPQNIFRLVTRSAWRNVSSELSFKITRINMVESPNRDCYSGILLFSRYVDSQNLYYAGLRMDGTAVVKKKIWGTYYTLAEGQVWNSDSGFDRNTNPNLIPGNRWMRLRTDVHDLPNGNVSITVYLDITNTGFVWVPLLSAVDVPGVCGGSPVIHGPAYAGVRTDYMDVLFDNFRLTEVP